MDLRDSLTGPSAYNAGNMRKGTRSCVECRRRKVRCIFSKDNQDSCQRCVKTNRQCQEQQREHFPSATTKKKRSTLRDRVAKLEALLDASNIQSDSASNTGADGNSLERLGRVDTETSEGSVLNQSYRSNSPSSEDEDSEDYDMNPLVSLFNNRLLRSQPPKKALKSADIYQPSIDLRIKAKQSHVLLELRNNLVSPHLLSEIIAAAGEWYQGWRPLGPWPPELSVAAGYSTLSDFLMFAYNSDAPAIVGLAVLCIAESIRKLEAQPQANAELIKQLPRPPQELFQILFERVDRLINSDSDFADSREGIDCLLMSGKLYSSLSLPRRTWMTFHKAIIYGQSHGYSRGIARSNENEIQRKLRQDAWDNLCQTDMFISMTLGLPYSSAGRSIPLNFIGSLGSTERFRRQITAAAGMLIDRDQNGLTNEIEPTKEINRVLEEAAQPMSAQFWSAPENFAEIVRNPSGMLAQMKPRLIEETRLQMMYWLIMLYTHLAPAMRSIEDSTLETFRFVCQAGCRGYLNIYNILRSDKRADLVNLIDYQAFISCSVLILGLLGYGGAVQNNLETPGQDFTDHNLVNMTLKTLRTMSETGNTIAEQALEGLEQLFDLTIRTQDGIRIGNGQPTKIRVPFVGTITVAPSCGVRTSANSSVYEGPSSQRMFTFDSQNGYGSDANPLYFQRQDNGMMRSDSMQMPVEPMVDSGYRSINFDFNQLMAMSNEDWTWIATEYPTTSYY